MFSRVRAKKREALAFLLVAVAVTASGCGGAGDSTSTTGTDAANSAKDSQAARRAFIVKGDSICQEADQEQTSGVNTYSKKHPGLGNFTKKSEQNELVLAVGLPAIQKEAERLAALTPPAGDEAAVSAIVVSIKKGVKKAEKNPQAALDTHGPFDEAGKLAKEFGFVECSKPS